MKDSTEKIAAVAAAKRLYDKQVAAIEVRVKVEKEVAKLPVIDAVNAALAAGISQNQVAIKGMGYAGLSPLKSFIGANGTTREALMAAAQAAKITIETPESDKWKYVIPDPIPVGVVFKIDGPNGKVLTYGLSTEWDAIMPEPDNDEEKAVNQLIYDRTHGTVKYAAAEQAEYGGK